MTPTPALLTWYDLERDCHFIEQWVRSLDPVPLSVYGIPRGGLPIATMLSHRCELPLLLNESEITEHTIIVDDVIEQGKTLGDLLARLKPIEPRGIFAWCNKTGGECVFNTVRRFPPDRWIVFPWEVPNRAMAEAEEFYAVRSASK